MEHPEHPERMRHPLLCRTRIQALMMGWVARPGLTMTTNQIAAMTRSMKLYFPTRPLSRISVRNCRILLLNWLEKVLLLWRDFGA
jgi:hypothetical protein